MFSDSLKIWQRSLAGNAVYVLWWRLSQRIAILFSCQLFCHMNRKERVQAGSARVGDNLGTRPARLARSHWNRSSPGSATVSRLHSTGGIQFRVMGLGSKQDGVISCWQRVAIPNKWSWILCPRYRVLYTGHGWKALWGDLWFLAINLQLKWLFYDLNIPSFHLCAHLLPIFSHVYAGPFSK